MDEEKSLTVFLVDRDGRKIDPSEADRDSWWTAEPCVEIGFFYEKSFFEGRTRELVYDRVVALIDTGADGIYVDRTLIEKFGCPIAEGGNSMIVNGESGHTAHVGSVFILEDQRAINLWVSARDFGKEGRRFKMALGRRFLQFCTLTYDGLTRDIALKFRGNAGAR